MNEPFRPTPSEFEAIVRFRAETRIQLRLRRLETGEANHTEDLIMQEATDRLAELAEEIGNDGVERIVAEVEEEVTHRLIDHDDVQYRVSGGHILRLLKHGTSEKQA